MGRKSIDVGDTVDEINAGAALIANAAQKLGEHGDSESTNSEPADTPPPKQPARNIEVVAATKRRSKVSPPESSVSGGDVPIRDTNQSRQDDPWVTGTVKMRNSKKKLLKELSLTRELAGLEPHQQKDLVDEALDYILDKYHSS